jgi:hypothetical protein
MIAPLFLYFSYEYFAAATFAGSPAVFMPIETDGFRAVPLFFEVKNAQIYPISAFSFHNAKGRNVYGNIFQAIEQNADFQLHSNNFPIANILTDTLQDIKQKYMTLHKLTKNEIVQLILVLPFDLSPKASERLQKFLKEHLAFSVVLVDNFVSIYLKDKDLLLQSTGEQALHFVEKNNSQVSKQSMQLVESEVAEKIAKLVVQKALKNSSTNIGEDEKQGLHKNYLGEARRWIEETKQRNTAHIRIEFSDGYAGEVLLTKEDLDTASLDSSLIVKKIGQLDFLQNFNKIIVAGNNLQNQVLISLLTAQFGAAKLQVLNDEQLYSETFYSLNEKWQEKEKRQVWETLQEQIAKFIQEQNGELTTQQVEEIEEIAKKYHLQSVDIQSFIKKESDKIIFTSFEPVGENTLHLLVKAKHKQHGWVLMKTLKDKYLQNAEYSNRLKVEFDWLKTKMQHPNLVTAVQYSAADEKVLYYLSEWLTGTQVAALPLPLASNEENHNLIKKYALQLANALQNLHQFHWYHAKLNDKHIFIENQVVKLTNTKVEYASAQHIAAKQQQNIKELGLILLQFLTGKNAPQAIQLLNDERQQQWKNIIQRTSGASSGNPYKSMQEMIVDLQNLDFEIKKPKKTWAWGKIIKFGLVGSLLALTLIFGVRNWHNVVSWAKDKLPKPAALPNAACLPFKQIYTGTYTEGDKKDLLVGLQLIDIQQQEPNVCLFTYHLRIQLADGTTLQERNQKGQVFIAQGRMRFENSKLGNVSFIYKNNKIVIVSDKFQGLELQ